MFVLWSCWSYCGELSSKRPSLAVEPEVETRLLSGGLSMETTLLPVRLLWVSSIHSCHALVYSGVEGNFLDSSLTHHLQLPIFTLQHKISVNANANANLFSNFGRSFVGYLELSIHTFKKLYTKFPLSHIKHFLCGTLKSIETWTHNGSVTSFWSLDGREYKTRCYVWHKLNSIIKK